MSARDDYPFLSDWLDGGQPKLVLLQVDIERVFEDLDRLRAVPCPHVRTSDEGTSYCSLGTA